MTTEMKSQRAEEPTPADVPDLDPQALAAIRDLLKSEPEAVPEPVAEPVPVAEEPMAAPASVAEAPAAPVSTRPVERTDYEAPRASTQTAGAAASATSSRIDRVKASITGYRPTPKHLIIAACALVVLLRPWLVVGLLLLTLFVFIGIFLILGYDGFWKRAMGLARWYARRRPSRAAELHRKLDDFAMKWDAFLDRFPEGTVDGLYLPDFGELATADARHDEALDRRLSSLREGEA